MRPKRSLAFLLAIPLIVAAPARPTGVVAAQPSPPKLLGVRAQYEKRLQWLSKRHALVLGMMRQHNVGMWIVVNEEFHDDPLTEHVAPPLTYVSRRDIHVFVDGGAEGLKRYSNYWRPTESYRPFFEPLPVPANERGIQDTGRGLHIVDSTYRPRTIAIASGGTRGQDSGLPKDTWEFLLSALGEGARERLVSAAPLIEEYLDTRLPEEMEEYRKLVQVTADLARRALSNEVIVPGKTTAADVAWWFNQQIASLGVGARPWFEIHTAVQRFDPQRREMIPYVHPAPERLVFQHGDVIHLDCGFNYMGLASDWQKVAYVLRPGETDVPQGLVAALENANRVQDALRQAARPGMTGWETATAAMQSLAGVTFTPSIYSHPIGTHGHGVGAQVNARNGVPGPRPASDSRLRLGNYRSIELSATTAIPEWNNGRLTIPMEDDAHLTSTGYEWFVPPQTVWYVIR